MSTKTTIKRIALVAASALGLGLLAVVPANAAITKPTTVALTASTPSTQSSYAAVSSTFSLTGQAASAATQTFDVVATLSTPVGSGAVPTMATTDNAIPAGSFTAAARTTTTANDTIRYTSAAAVVAMASTVAGTVSFTPDYSGQYTLTLTVAGTVVTSAIVVNVSTATGIQVSYGTTGNGTALSTSGKYTASQVLTTAGISAFSVTAGKAVVLSIRGIGGTIGTSDVQKVALRNYGYVVASAAASSGGATTADTDLALASFNAPSIPGTYYLDVTDAPGGTYAASTDLTTTVTMTVTAASALSVGTSTAYGVLGNGTSAASSTTDLVPLTASKSLAATNRAAITVSLNDADGTAMASGNTISVTVTGPGYIKWSTANTPTADSCSATPTYSATLGKAISAQATDAVGTLYVCSDGTVGTASIKITVTDAFLVSQVLATKSVLFYGTTTSLKVATKNFTIGYATGATTGAAATARTATGEVTNAGALTTGTTTPAFIIKTYDSAGSLAGTTVPTVVSSNTAVVTSGTCALDDGSSATYSSSTNGIGVFNCNFTTGPAAKSGDKATLTFRIVDPAGDGTTYLSDTADVTVGGDPYTESIAFDATSYDPGAKMAVTRTAVDSAGNPVADGSSVGAVTFNKAVGGTAPAAGFYVGGKKSASVTSPVYAPSVDGDFVARMNGYKAGVALSEISATATVNAATGTSAAQGAVDAANEATDAANAATDAANAAAEAADAATAAAQDAQAAVAALASQVADLISGIKAQITALTNLVIKIQKKVKA